MDKFGLIDELRIVSDKAFDRRIIYDKLTKGKSELENKIKLFRYDRWLYRSEEQIIKEIRRTQIELESLEKMIVFLNDLKNIHKFTPDEINQLFKNLLNPNLKPDDAQNLYRQIKNNKELKEKKS